MRCTRTDGIAFTEKFASRKTARMLQEDVIRQMQKRRLRKYVADRFIFRKLKLKEVRDCKPFLRSTVADAAGAAACTDHGSAEVFRIPRDESGMQKRSRRVRTLASGSSTKILGKARYCLVRLATTWAHPALQNNMCAELVRRERIDTLLPGLQWRVECATGKATSVTTRKTESGCRVWRRRRTQARRDPIVTRHPEKTKAISERTNIDVEPIAEGKAEQHGKGGTIE